MRMRIARRCSGILAAAAAVFFSLAPGPDSADLGPLVRLLRICQDQGNASASDPANDQRLKAILAKNLAKKGGLTREGALAFMSAETFDRIAGSDGLLDDPEAQTAMESSIPASRSKLLPDVAAHMGFLSTSLDQIGEPHREVSRKLAQWIAKNHQPGSPLSVVVVCTGNSRRSILGATLGNISASYCGMPEVRFTSGGTAPTAFNPRTIASLKTIGVAIEPTGKEAPRGEPKTANPIMTVRWGEGDSHLDEFSKKFTDPSQPQSGFAAILVCSEADEACPFVKGAALRVSSPYLDPKIYDGSAYETAKYAERRDDIGRMMLSAMLQARAMKNAN